MEHESTPQLINREPHLFFGELLGQIEAAQVLDVACGPGGFTGLLKESLKGYAQITGVDLNPTVLAEARQHHPGDDLHFEQQDAAALSYPDAAFDLVACAFSLHHLPQPQQSLAEMQRVLKPGGILLIVEMYRDQLAQTQFTETLIHHWAAEIDTALGISHNPTFARQEILDLVQPMHFTESKIYDLADLNPDPKGEKINRQVLETIERVLKKAEALPDYPAHQHRADQLRQRVQRFGTHISTRLVILARK